MIIPHGHIYMDVINVKSNNTYSLLCGLLYNKIWPHENKSIGPLSQLYLIDIHSCIALYISISNAHLCVHYLDINHASY